MKIYNKLVRDGIPDIISGSGAEYTCHTAEGEEYLLALKAKVCEELQEFYEKPCAEEMGDILEVLHALASFHGISWDEAEAEREIKNRKRGGFSRRIILEEVHD